MSGLKAGQSRRFMPISRRNCRVRKAVWIGALSCWKTPLPCAIRCHLSVRCWWRTFMYFVASSRSSILTKSLNALIEKVPPNERTIAFRHILLWITVYWRSSNELNTRLSKTEFLLVGKDTHCKYGSISSWFFTGLCSWRWGWVDRAVFLARGRAFKLACSKRFITVLLLQVSRNFCCIHLADIKGSWDDLRTMFSSSSSVVILFLPLKYRFVSSASPPAIVGDTFQLCFLISPSTQESYVLKICMEFQSINLVPLKIT